MEEPESFGYWLRRRRKALDLTQDALARRVGYSLGAIRKLEADERRPSLELAERLAQVLELAPDERACFLKVARAELAVDRLTAPTDSVDLASPRPAGGPPALPSSHVPLPLTPFIGREREVSALQQRLQAPLVRLVTLTGPGGAGKTRLALQVALELRDGFRDGVFVVALAPIRDPALVALAIAQTLDVREAPPRPLWESLQDELRDKRLLLN